MQSIMRCGNCGFEITGRPAHCPRCAAKLVYMNTRLRYGTLVPAPVDKDSCSSAPIQKEAPHLVLTWLGYIVRGALAFVVWFASFAILVRVPIFSEVEDGISKITSPIPLFVPIALAICVFVLMKKPLHSIWTTVKQGRSDSAIENPKSKIPFFPKGRVAAVEKLTKQAALHYEQATESDSVDLFVYYWKRMEEDLDSIKPYYGKVPSSCTMSAHTLTGRVKNKQWKLRDVMERAKNRAIADIKGEHHNNKLGRYSSFKDDIDRHYSIYDAETAAFAQSMLAEVARAAGIGGAETQSCENDIDHMEGHAFEYWCANLLAKIGYTDVSVTRGSGDQGVDVLAQKDGIKYAIQCKCYSSDLGNTPVQEVLAGKKFYHCHIGAVMTNRHFTRGAKELAEETGVLLWDRDWINQAIAASNSK